MVNSDTTQCVNLQLPVDGAGSFWMLNSLGDRHGVNKEYGTQACCFARHKFESYCSVSIGYFLFDVTATFNMLLKLSKRAGSYSQHTAAAIFQEMLHLGIG